MAVGAALARVGGVPGRVDCRGGGVGLAGVRRGGRGPPRRRGGGGVPGRTRRPPPRAGGRGEDDASAGLETVTSPSASPTSAASWTTTRATGASPCPNSLLAAEGQLVTTALSIGLRVRLAVVSSGSDATELSPKPLAGMPGERCGEVFEIPFVAERPKRWRTASGPSRSPPRMDGAVQTLQSHAGAICRCREAGRLFCRFVGAPLVHRLCTVPSAAPTDAAPAGSAPTRRATPPRG